MLKLSITLLALLATLAPQAAYIAGDVFIATDTSGTNAVPTNTFNITSTNASLAGTLRADSGVFTNTLTVNGTAVSTFTGTAGTVINTGTPASGQLPLYSDTTGTNIAPSSANATLWDGSQASRTLTFSLSGATDPTITAADALISFNTGLQLLNSGVLAFGSDRSRISSTLNGRLTITEADGSGFGLLQFGGTSASFPAIEFTAGPSLEFRTANDSAFIPILAGTLTLTPAAANTTARTISGGSNTGSDVTPGESFAWTWNTSGHAIAKRNIVTETAAGTDASYERWENGSGVQVDFRKNGNIISNLRATKAVAGTIASAATIAPTAPITFISGTDAIDTITAPSPISATGGQITLIPTAIWTTTTSGNIALATTAVVGKALILFYDATTTKWYPSY